jgi:pilus assembly protein Flp/PilA
MYKTKRNKKEKGQGLVEYALILVLVAIVVIAVLMLLGPIIGGVFSTINDSLSGVGGIGGGVAAAPAHSGYWDWDGSDYQPLFDAMDAYCAGKPSGTQIGWALNGTNHYWVGDESQLPAGYSVYNRTACP